MEKKICLITGTSGFIGKQVALKLHEKGHDVYCLERYVAGRTIYNKHNLKTVFADLNDHFAVNQIIKELKPEVVFHIAAISPVAFSYKHPIEVNETNYLATINLAESCMRTGCLQHFLFAGTSEEYGNQTEFPIKESAPLLPNSPYSAAKVASDIYLNFMRESYEFPVTILRPFNTFGRVDDTHFLVENIITQMLNGKTVNLGMPEPIRDLMYLDDHVNAYLTCFENPTSIGATFNFCTGVGWRIPDIVEMIAELLDWNGSVNWNTIPKRPNDIMNLTGSNMKAKTFLNWHPKFNLEDGLQLTIEKLKEKRTCHTVGAH
jgi:nucleoside-diphosphate-sugar epimerase